jgi:hypothetical protein
VNVLYFELFVNIYIYTGPALYILGPKAIILNETFIFIYIFYLKIIFIAIEIQYYIASIKSI